MAGPNRPDLAPFTNISANTPGAVAYTAYRGRNNDQPYTAYRLPTEYEKGNASIQATYNALPDAVKAQTSLADNSFLGSFGSGANIAGRPNLRPSYSTIQQQNDRRNGPGYENVNTGLAGFTSEGPNDTYYTHDLQGKVTGQYPNPKQSSGDGFFDKIFNGVNDFISDPAKATTKFFENPGVKEAATLAALYYGAGGLEGLGGTAAGTGTAGTTAAMEGGFGAGTAAAGGNAAALNAAGMGAAGVSGLSGAGAAGLGAAGAGALGAAGTAGLGATSYGADAVLSSLGATSGVGAGAGALGAAGAAGSGLASYLTPTVLATGAGIVGGLIQNAGQRQAASMQSDAAQRAMELQAASLDKQLALQEPYRQAGLTGQNRLMELLGLGGNAGSADYGKYGRDFSMADYTADPGYAFRLSEGMKQLGHSASRGGLVSGQSMKGLQDYAQNSASQEYSNAFNRYQTNRANQLQPLGNLMTSGQNAASNQGSNIGNYGSNAANLIGQQGQAQAAGALGYGNTINNAIGSGISAYQNNALVEQLRRLNPSTYGVPQ